MKISKNYILNLLIFIIKCISDERYAAINESCGLSESVLHTRIEKAQKRLECYGANMIPADSSNSPFVLMSQWQQFDKDYDGTVTVDIKCKYDGLVKSTINNLDHIMSLSPIDNNDQTESVISVEKAKLRKRNISNKRNSLLGELEKQKSKKPQDEDAVKYIEEQLEKLNAEYNEISDATEKAESDAVVVDNVSKRISEAFEQLKLHTKDIEEERKHVKREYLITLGCIPVFTACFIGFYIWFLIIYNGNMVKFNSWLAFLPYTIIIPIYIALLWLCVYLKDRASKISIELSTRLFSIHYLEGLMKLTNSLSSNSSEAVKRISTTADALMKSYLSQISKNHLTEAEISKMESKELESNPYWKYLHEVKDLIKLIKQ